LWSVPQLLYRNAQRLRGGLVFKDHRLLYHSTLGLRVIKKIKKNDISVPQISRPVFRMLGRVRA